MSSLASGHSESPGVAGKLGNSGSLISLGSEHGSRFSGAYGEDDWSLSSTNPDNEMVYLAQVSSSLMVYLRSSSLCRTYCRSSSARSATQMPDNKTQLKWTTMTRLNTALCLIRATSVE